MVIKSGFRSNLGGGEDGHCGWPSLATRRNLRWITTRCGLQWPLCITRCLGTWVLAVMLHVSFPVCSQQWNFFGNCCQDLSAVCQSISRAPRAKARARAMARRAPTIRETLDGFRPPSEQRWPYMILFVMCLIQLSFLVLHVLVV